jgi:hypothetical protein
MDGWMFTKSVSMVSRPIEYQQPQPPLIPTHTHTPTHTTPRTPRANNTPHPHTAWTRKWAMRHGPPRLGFFRPPRPSAPKHHPSDSSCSLWMVELVWMELDEPDPIRSTSIHPAARSHFHRRPAAEKKKQAAAGVRSNSPLIAYDGHPTITHPSEYHILPHSHPFLAFI